jgi:hypothetical protein
MSKIYLGCILLALAVSIGSSAFAQTRPVRAGTLICDADARVGLVLGSRRDMRCMFHASAGGADAYRGLIRRVGIDIGVTRGGTLTWAVFAPGNIGPGALRGHYVGASANAALGIGLGVKVLVGGPGRRITLQPLSIEGQIGLNVALAVSNLTLR